MNIYDPKSAIGVFIILHWWEIVSTILIGLAALLGFVAGRKTAPKKTS
jgi:hypothetical protein